MPAVRSHSKHAPVPVPATTWLEDRNARYLKMKQKEQETLEKRKLVEASLAILASQATTRDEKMKAAEALKQGVCGNRGMDDLLHTVIPRLEGVCQAQARRDYKTFLRYPMVIYEALEMYGLAGKALIELNRPNKHGDGQRAFFLLNTFIVAILDALVDFYEPGLEQWRYIHNGSFAYHELQRRDLMPGQLEEIQAVEATYKPTVEEERIIAEEKEEVFHLLYSTYDEPFRTAIRQFKAEAGPKRSTELCEKGYKWSLDVSGRCCELYNECRYRVRKERDMYREEREDSSNGEYCGPTGEGSDIFWRSRDELYLWYYGYKDLMREASKSNFTMGKVRRVIDPLDGLYTS